MAISKRSTVESLKLAAQSYLVKIGFSVHFEIGVTSWGKLRADVLALNLRGYIYLMEIKSSTEDYKTDKKWRQYLDYSNKMWFVFTEPVWEKLKERIKVDLHGSGVGVLVLCSKTGYLRSVMPVKHRLMKKKTKRLLTVRLAWRGGTSKRTTRRQRVFLTEEDAAQAKAVKAVKKKRSRRPSKRARRSRGRT